MKTGLSLRHGVFLFLLPFVFTLSLNHATHAATITKTFGGIVFYQGQPVAGATVLLKKCTGMPNCYLYTYESVVTNSSGYYSTTLDVICNDNWYNGGQTGIFGVSGRVLLYNLQYGPGGGVSGGMSCWDPTDYSNSLNLSAPSPPDITDPQNTGPDNPSPICPVGEPVNPTNGNMYVQHFDFRPQAGSEALEIARTYNSISRLSGRFGYGWSSVWDARLTYTSSSEWIILRLGSGQVVYFGDTGSGVHKPVTKGFEGQILRTSADFTLTYKDGSVDKFNWQGRLFWKKDRNGNQTTLTYDSNAKLIAITDSFGRVLTVTSDANLRVTQISDTVGAIATYEYDASGYLKTVSYPDGSKYKFEYISFTLSGQSWTVLATVKDALDKILETHEYDSQGRATTSELHGGVEKYTFDYTNSNLSVDPYTTVTDALGRVSKYYFDRSKGVNVVTKTEGACSCGGSGTEVRQFEYDARLNVTKLIDGEGNMTQNTFDSNNNLIQSVDALGTRKWTYNGLGQILTYQDRVDSSGTSNTVVNTFDSKGNLLTTTDALGNVATLTYTTVGQLATVTDARSKTTGFTYDTQGRLTTVTDANNKNTTFGYDARARVTSVTNALNETTSFTYDLNNRPKRTTFPDTNYIEHTYDLGGRRTATRDPRGNSTTFGYDNAYRLTTITDALSHARAFGYDLMSNLTSQTDPLGNTTNFEYDDFNRLKKVIYPAASLGASRLEESMTYDKVGNVKTRVDTAGRTTSYDYDASNRLTKITDALTSQTQFEYNLRSQLTQVKDALNQEYVFTYDPLGRTLSQTRAGTTMSFEYDAVGNRTKRTDHNGTVTNYTYDNLNRLTSGSLGSYTYDDLSRMLTAMNSNGTVSFTYDNRGRVDTTTDVYGKVIDYDYDANGNRIGMKLNGTSMAGYSYDNADRLASITNVPESAVTNYGYDIADRLISKALPNGITTTYSYDDMSRLSRIKDANSTSTLLDRQYGYNTANQIATINDLNRTKTYSYDNVDRLTGVTDSISGSVESYAYNAVGNRTTSHLSSTYSHNPFNRLSSTSSASYGYDNNGAMTSRTDSSGTMNLSYDSDGRLVFAYNDSWQFAEFRYDALGRRIYKSEPNDLPRSYTYDGEDMLVQNWAGFDSTYLNGPGIDNKLSAKLAGGTSSIYYHLDHLGTPTGNSNAAGSLTAYATPDSFGNGSFEFTGREYDDFTELYYYRARMYDPQLGRFISEDPIGFAAGEVNLHGYVGSNPQNLRDPSGRIAVPVVVVVAWAAIEAGLTIYDAYSFAESLSDPCADAIDVGFGGSGLLIGAFAPGGGYGIGLKALRRPYIRKSTREGAERVARRDPTTGDFLDYNTGERIPDGKYDLGHRYGDEYWRLRDKATREGLSQKEFNDLLNDPDLYRIEHPRSNRSHAFEMPK